jgi:signal transduction protein with GAF and PtsI domain
MLATLFDLGFQAGTAANAGEALERIHPVVQRVMPADIVAVYLYRAETDNLVATFVVGAHAETIAGTTIQLGQRLTGWVAANRESIVNSDAALDLGNVAMTLDPTPLACLSSPICAGADLVGVITIYSTRRQPFAEAHVPVIEVIATGLASLLRQSAVTTASAPVGRAVEHSPANRVH